jgi:NAD(P)-dependent dehydrogenase (short-subunit alcohol dehydrogenase family)
MTQDNQTRPVALVTGASEGLGAGIATALARDGFDVAVSELRTEALANTVAAVQATGGRAVPVALDLCAPGSVEAAFAAVRQAFGRVDVLVNNAGITLRRSAIDMTEAEWNKVIQTNLTGTVFMTQQMGRYLIGAKRPGCVISIASAHGVLGFSDRLAYGVSKAGIIQMTRMLAIEWASHGIRVNAIAPGTVETPSRAPFLADPASRKMMLSRIPLGRFGTIDDVAAAAAYLASPGASYITGQTLLLDGGLTAY